jgi:hypothetical protein
MNGNEFFFLLLHTPVVREAHQVYKLNEINDRNQVPNKYQILIYVFSSKINLLLLNHFLEYHRAHVNYQFEHKNVRQS